MIAMKQQYYPNDWRLVCLGDVADVSFSTVDKKIIDGETHIQLCNYTDVFYNSLITTDMEFMTATATSVECSRYSLKKGDVLFTKDSETPNEIGIPALVLEDMPDVLCGYHLALARPKVGLIAPSFMAKVLLAPAVRRQFAKIANGVTRFGLTLEATRSLLIPIPSVTEQYEISAMLDSIDEAIETAATTIATTESLRDALLYELLVRCGSGRQNADRQRRIRCEWNQWENTTVGNFAPFNYGKPLKKSMRNQSGHIPVFGSNGVVGWHDKAVTEGPTVIIGRKGSAGSVHYSPVPCWPIDTTFFVTGHDPMLVRFKYYILRILRLENFNSDNAVPGLNRGAAHARVLRIPTEISEQRTIAIVLNQVDEVIEHTIIWCNALSILKSAVSNALLTGRIRI